MGKIVWVNGCFDIIHYGHIKLLEFAKKQGDRLIIGIDHDDRISKVKGSDRPINNFMVRSSILKAIKYVDEVIVFDTDSTLVSSIKNCKANIIVVGDEYKHKKVIGSEVVDEVIFFEKIPNFSTSKLINNLKL